MVRWSQKVKQRCCVYTSDQHGGDREDLFGIGVGRDVAKADGSETGAGEVQRWDVRSHRAGKVWAFAVERIVEFLRQLIQPSYHRRQRISTPRIGRRRLHSCRMKGKEYYTVSQKTSHLWLAITLTRMNGFWYSFGRNVTDKVSNERRFTMLLK